jgi:ectoine hydroxylase-related dioxygenase (phytanoyl-CoA dioxygenase family)
MLRNLGSAETARFERDGFLVFEPQLPAAEIDEIRQMLTRLHANNTGFEEGALFDALSPEDADGPKRFPQIMHPRVYAPRLQQTTFFRTAEQIAKQLLGPDVRFKADISLMKPAGIGEATPWHQDEAFQDPAFDYRELSFWLALQPVDESNSCMAYIPGSHRGEVVTHRFPHDDSRIHALDCGEGLDVRDAVACPLPAGGCVIHTQRTIHGAGPNVSDRERMAYVLIFDVVPVPARIHREFPWRATHQTARAKRELAWRRRGGLLVHLWRQRSRVRVTDLPTLLYDCRKALRATVGLCRGRWLMWRRLRLR